MVMINHGISTGALFLLIGMIYERRHTRLIDDVRRHRARRPDVRRAAHLRLAQQHRRARARTASSASSSCCSARSGRIRSSPSIATTGVIFAAAYLLWAIQRILFNPLDKPENEHIPDLNRRELAMMVPLVAVHHLARRLSGAGAAPHGAVGRAGSSTVSARAVDDVAQQTCAVRAGAMSTWRSTSRVPSQLIAALAARPRPHGRRDAPARRGRVATGQRRRISAASASPASCSASSRWSRHAHACSTRRHGGPAVRSRSTTSAGSSTSSSCSATVGTHRADAWTTTMRDRDHRRPSRTCWCCSRRRE